MNAADAAYARRPWQQLRTVPSGSPPDRLYPYGGHDVSTTDQQERMLRLLHTERHHLEALQRQVVAALLLHEPLSLGSGQPHAVKLCPTCHVPSPCPTSKALDAPLVEKSR